MGSSILRESIWATWRTSPNHCRILLVFSFFQFFRLSLSRLLLFFRIFSPTRFAKRERMILDADHMQIRWRKEYSLRSLSRKSSFHTALEGECLGTEKKPPIYTISWMSLKWILYCL